MRGEGVLSRLLKALTGRAEPKSANNPFGAEPLPPLEHLLEHVQPAVDGGFAGRDDIIELASDVTGEENLPFTREEIASIIDERLAEHAARQAGWPAVTDNDRLETAFADLEGRGIVVRQNFTCCGSCGSYEIWDEIARHEEGGAKARGYAFYHSQDAEGAAGGERLHLSYGSVEEGDEASVAIAEEIATALRAAGLDVTWNGAITQRIGVDMEWRRRRPNAASSDMPHREGNRRD